VRVLRCQTSVRNESDDWKPLKAAPSTDHLATASRFEWEHLCRDPKDGELCLNRAKPGETLVEARSACDVQIHRKIWV
jgi:hypothetical protein